MVQLVNQILTDFTESGFIVCCKLLWSNMLYVTHVATALSAHYTVLFSSRRYQLKYHNDLFSLRHEGVSKSGCMDPYFLYLGIC
jgi:hypothetical protein